MIVKQSEKTCNSKQPFHEVIARDKKIVGVNIHPFYHRDYSYF